MFWKVVGELQRPKYMTIGWYRPYLVLNTAFLLVSLFDAYFVEPSFYVELAKDECVLYFCGQFRYQREWIPIADGMLVDTSVVLYRSL